LSSEPLALTPHLRRSEREFLLGNVRVTMKSSLENIQAGDYTIEKFEEGASEVLPRWVAEELEAAGLAEIQEEPFEAEVFRALSKEKMMGPLQLSGLSSDFYVRMRRRLDKLQKEVGDGKAKHEDFQRLRAACYDLVGMRLSKILSQSGAASSAPSVSEKLAPEEKTFFSLSQSLAQEWKSALLAGGK